MSEQDPPTDLPPPDLPPPPGPPTSGDAGTGAAAPDPLGGDLPAPPPPGATAPRAARKKAAPRPAAPRRTAPNQGDRPQSGKKTPPPVDDAAATRRGIIVLAVTVVVGLIIFAQGIQHDEAVNTAGSSGNGAPTTTIKSKDEAPTTTQPSQGTTLPKAPATKVPSKDIKIVVANAVDPSKVIAGPMGEKLSVAGYNVTSKLDISPAVDKSVVYYTGDLKAEATAVAKIAGFADSAVAQMPEPPPTPLNGAQMIVVVGKDKG